MKIYAEKEVTFSQIKYNAEGNDEKSFLLQKMVEGGVQVNNLKLVLDADFNVVKNDLVYEILQVSTDANAKITALVEITDKELKGIQETQGYTKEWHEKNELGIPDYYSPEMKKRMKKVLTNK